MIRDYLLMIGDFAGLMITVNWAGEECPSSRWKLKDGVKRLACRTKSKFVIESASIYRVKLRNAPGVVEG